MEETTKIIEYLSYHAGYGWEPYWETLDEKSLPFIGFVNIDNYVITDLWLRIKIFEETTKDFQENKYDYNKLICDITEKEYSYELQANVYKTLPQYVKNFQTPPIELENNYIFLTSNYTIDTENNNEKIEIQNDTGINKFLTIEDVKIEDKDYKQISFYLNIRGNKTNLKLKSIDFDLIIKTSNEVPQTSIASIYQEPNVSNFSLRSEEKQETITYNAPRSVYVTYNELPINHGGKRVLYWKGKNGLYYSPHINYNQTSFEVDSVPICFSDTVAPWPFFTKHNNKIVPIYNIYYREKEGDDWK